MRRISFGAIPLTAALLLCAASPSSAQPAGSAAARHETIMVYAPYVVKRHVISPMPSKGSATGLELVSVSQAVSFADLDLSDADQVKQLEARVRQAAVNACGEIDKRYPKSRFIPVPENQDCVGNATSAAFVTVKALEVAAAKY
jgi:UrcA family protein